MPGGNNQEQEQIPINAEGFLVGSYINSFAQVISDVSRTSQPGKQPAPIEGAPTQDELSIALKRAGHNPDRSQTITSNFYFYLMGVKGMSFEEAVKVIPPNQNNYQNHVKDFWKFIKDNPIRDVDNENKTVHIAEDKRRASIKNWSDLCHNCAMKFAEYRLPDIDYSDPSEVGKHGHELYFLASILQDFTQETEAFFRLYPAEARQASGEYDRLYYDTTYFTNLQGFTDILKKAQFPLDKGASTQTKRVAAATRVLLKDYSQIVKGKTVRELNQRDLHRLTDSQTLSQAGIAFLMTDDPNVIARTGVQAANQILHGGHDQAFEEEVRNQYRIYDLDTINKLNNKYLEMGDTSFSDYINTQSLKDPLKNAVTQLFAGNPSNEEIIRRFNDNLNGNLPNLINEAFHAFNTEGRSLIRKDMGVELMDMFYVNGQTPADLWGDKYKTVQDPIKYQILLQAELLNVYYTTNKSIDIDTPQITGDYKLKLVRQPLARSPLLIRRGYDFLDRINELHGQFKEELNTLRSVEASVPEGERALLAPAEEYGKMKETLKNCIEKSRADKGGFDTLCFALQEYQKACKAYADKRVELIRSGALNENDKSIEFVNALNYQHTLALGNISKISSIEQEIRGEAKRFGLMFSEDDQVKDHGRLLYSGEYRKFGHFKTNLDLEVTTRSFDPKDFTPESRKKFYHEEDYQWMEKRTVVNPENGKTRVINPWTKSVGKEHHNFLTEELELSMGNDPLYYFNSLGKQLNPVVNGVDKNGEPERYNENGVYFSAIGSSASREDTNMSVFCLWLMGEKGYSLEDVAKMTGRPVLGADGKYKYQDRKNLLPQLEKDFIKFIADHPLRDSIRGEGAAYEVKITAKKTEAEYSRDVKAWTDVFSKATAKMKEYRIPDIDYSDKNQVKSKESEIVLLRELSINFGQELPKIFASDHPVKPTVEFAYEQMGGEEKYNKMVQDWIAIQALVTPVCMGYFFPSSVNERTDLGMYLGKTVSAAGYRMAAEEELDPYKGKTFGEAVNHYGGRGICRLDIQNKLLASDLVTGMEEFDPKPYLGYLSGRERKAYQNSIQKDYTKGLVQGGADTQERLHDAALHLLDFRFVTDSSVMRAWMNDALKNMDDSAQSMQDFLKMKSEQEVVDGQVRPLENSTSVRHAIRERFYQYLKSDYNGVLGVTEKKLTDLFLIDGQTPEEKWGAKYANLSALDKDACMLGEIAKTLIKADAKVEIRDYKFTKDGDLKETNPLTVAENATKLKELSKAAEQIKFATSELRRELLDLQKDFLKTQDNRNNNRYHKPGHAGNKLREGTDLYQNMTVLLDRCIQELDEKSGTTQHELEEHLAQLRIACETYYEARYGRFFRPIHDHGKQRLTASEKTMKITASFENRLKTIRNELDSSNMFAAEIVEEDENRTKLEPLVNAPVKDLDKFIQRANRRTGQKPSSKEELEQKYAADQKDEFLHRVHREKRPEGAEGTNDLNLAYIYLQHTAEYLYNNNNITARDIRRIDRFQDEVQKLSKNPLFLRCARAGIENCVRDWNEIENRAEVKLEALKADMNNMERRNGSFARYLAKPEGELKPKDRYTEEELGQFREDAVKKLEVTLKKVDGIYAKPKERREVYRKVAKVVVMQLLTENSTMAERTLQSIAADELAHSRNGELKGDKTMKQLINSAYKFFEGKKILEQGNVRETLEKLDNGSLKNDFKKHMETQFKADLESARTQNRPGIQMADPHPAQVGNNGHGVGMG